MKEFADDNFKFDENGGKFSEGVENTDGKRKRVISSFSTFFSKHLFCTLVKQGLTKVNSGRLLSQRDSYRNQVISIH